MAVNETYLWSWVIDILVTSKPQAKPNEMFFQTKNVVFPLGENFCQKASNEKQNLNSASEYTYLLLKVILQVFLPLCFSPCCPTHFHHWVSYRKIVVASFVQALFSFGSHAAFWKKNNNLILKWYGMTELRWGRKNCCLISIYIYMCIYLYFLCSFIESGLLTCFLFLMGNIVLSA